MSKKNKKQKTKSMMCFAKKWEGMLPPIMNRILHNAKSDADADMMLLTAMASMSACLPNVQGLYDNRVVYPNLFLFISAPASAGKGRLMMAKKIVEPVHRELRQAYQDELAQFQQEMEEKGKTVNVDIHVPQTMLFMPANSSSTALYQTLHDCGGSGLIFETEADTLATSLKSDFGNFSDGLRKAFHHETISYSRRKDREYVEILTPRLSVVLAGTPRQIRNLIPDAENGLFSRFIMYRAELKMEWNDVFARRSMSDDEYYSALGSEFYALYSRLKALNYKMEFALTEEQESRFNAMFEKWQLEVTDEYGVGITPSVRRMGLIAYRMAMILSALRLDPRSTMPSTLVCNDTDFCFALDTVDVLLGHVADIYAEFPSVDEDEVVDLLPQEQIFLNALPQEFGSKEYQEISSKMYISCRTAQRYIQNFIKLNKITKIRRNKYEKSKI